MLKRASGVLINVSSLPSEYGIGGFGKEIESLCKFLKSGGFSYWQVLPLTTIGLGNSPYSGNSAFAINYLYVDPDSLYEAGFVDKEDVNNAKSKASPYLVNYDEVYAKKSALLHKAFNNKKDLLANELNNFYINNPWVKSYAMYMTLKEKFNNVSWINWPNKYKYIENIDEEKMIKENQLTFDYYVFEQYVLDFQWKNIKEKCNNLGIKIIGDMPMYVSLDSVDVWANRLDFQLYKNGQPKKVAGVPPDYFSEDGQLWGNPLYDYKQMQKDNYSWWIKRIDQAMHLYDICRIDHFRAFSEYWAIPANSTTAKNGKWVKGVGMDLFNEIFKKYDKDKFIAEDLGIIDNKVRNLINKTKLPGMRVMQFAFGEENSIHLPCNYPKNVIGYTATHDNNTTLGWLYELDEATRDKVLKYLNCDKSVWGRGAYDNVSIKLMIKKLMESECMLAIVPVQDLYGFGADCRMNTPGVAEGNWRYRTIQEQLDNCRINYFYELNKATGRI